MTSGSWNGDSSGPDHQTFHYKTWSGADRPRVKYAKPEPYYIYRNGKRYRIVPRAFGTRPPKRALDAPHNYVMSQRYTRRDVWRREERDPGNCVPQGYEVWSWTTSYCTDQSHGNGTSLGQDQFTSNDQIKLVAKLREKLTGSDFNASVFLGESHQTLALITDSATRIYRAMRSLKAGNIAHAANILTVGTARESASSAKLHRAKALSKKTVGSAWLELQYGWLPLVSDAASAAEQLAHALEVPFKKRYQVVSTRKAVTPKTPFTSNLPCGLRASYTISTESRRSLIVYVQEKMSTAATLGLLNPENVLWELTPWSFVADWFIPIGSYLDARAITSCVNGSYVQSNKTAFRMSGFGGNVGWGGTAMRGVDFSRSVSSSPSLPLPAFKGIGKAASWQHCANAVALLTSGAWGSGKARIR